MFILAIIILYQIFKLNLDFGLILLVATFFAAFSWLLGKYIDLEELRKESKSYFFILLAITCIRSFAYEPYQIPSRSMVPGLQVGDFVLVNKYAYGIKFPGTHFLLSGLVQPKRNDVAVFIAPIHYAITILLLPGQTSRPFLWLKDNYSSINLKICKTVDAHLWE